METLFVDLKERVLSSLLTYSHDTWDFGVQFRVDIDIEDESFVFSK